MKKRIKSTFKKKQNFYLGDIVINFFKIKKTDKKENFLKELNKLWIHGFLHLLGHDHKIYKDYIKMNKIEKRYLYMIEND